MSRHATSLRREIARNEAVLATDPDNPAALAAVAMLKAELARITPPKPQKPAKEPKPPKPKPSKRKPVHTIPMDALLGAVIGALWLKRQPKGRTP